MKINEISAWEAYLAVAKACNFSKASKELKVPLPQISKRIARLELELGIRLFNRTTRSVSLTDEGKSLLPKITAILEDLKEAEDLFESQDTLKGKIKITCVPFVARRLILPIINDFLSIYPDIQIELHLSETFINIVEAGYDMAIRIETPKDTDFIYRKLASNQLIVCASPKYLKNLVKIKNPLDLKHHEMLMLNVHKKCFFQNTDINLGQFTGSKRLTCENGNFLTEMALAGRGVLIRSIWDVQKYLKDGDLIQLLKNYPLENFGHINAVVPSRRYLAPRVRTFMDYLAEKSKDWKILPTFIWLVSTT